jgi:GT2 family glycosyltransferase
LSLQSEDNQPVVCDSGTSDETRQAVASEFPDTIVLNGHPDLWWTGAINLGLRYILEKADKDDSFLLLNDDTLFDDGYLAALMNFARTHPRSIVGSVCVDQNAPEVIIDGGVKFNWYSARMTQLNVGCSLSGFDKGHAEKVSVLPGRGTLFPVFVIDEIGLPAEKILPHYGADYDYTRRANRAGFDLMVCYDAAIKSNVATTGQHHRQTKISFSSARAFFFGRKSSGNLVDRFQFSFRAAENPIAGTLFFLCSTARLVNRYLAYRE